MSNVVTPFVMLLGASASINKTAPLLGLPQALQQSWAQYSPYFPVETYVPPPAGCEVVQVHLLQREGARYPTTSAGEAIQESVTKIKGATGFNDPKLAFVEGYEYTLGVNDLVPFGAAQSFDAGQEHVVRYASLVSQGMLPFVRTTEEVAVLNSALNWTAGFAHASKQKFVPELNVIMSQSGNNTLDDKMCLYPGTPQFATEEWVDIFTHEAVHRINAQAPDANLNGTDVVNLMTLCSLETAAYETLSPWCSLFTGEEFRSFEYYGDLDGFYRNGYGNELGPVQGVGYVNELLARLTGQPVQDETQTNHTLDDSPITFPLNRTFYADFTHDRVMNSVFSVLGLFDVGIDLDLWERPYRRLPWITSRMVPFSGRMITEKLACDGFGRYGEYVRVLVNDALQPLYVDAAGDGIAALANFVEEQDYARNSGHGDLEACFVDIQEVLRNHTIINLACM